MTTNPMGMKPDSNDTVPPREHEWFTYGRLNWECCRVCGIVRRMDGKNSPCKGPVSVGPRDKTEQTNG